MVPEERVTTLRNAFANMMGDTEFLADAQKLQVDINYMSGQDLQTLVERVAQFPPDLTAHARELVKP
jgi:tripartite-type tricarboxylate transporter receptor subunit TctC